jgi:DNA replication and repair protein RecF
VFVKNISIENFRNFVSLCVNFHHGINIIHGDNAQGKTNLLEAVGFCAAGRSNRANTDSEMIRFGETAAYVRAEYIKNDISNTVDTCIKKEINKTKKYLSINHVTIRKWNDFLGKLLIVSFSPDDLQLIKAGPSGRRMFMDAEISQLNPVYYNELREYNRALKQRNHLIKVKNRDITQELPVWDEQLAHHGRNIMRIRQNFTDELNTITREIHAAMTHKTENLSVTYKPNIKTPESYEQVLKANYTRDTALGSTSSGIHRDDVLFEINNTPARLYGSQGQQRTAALSVKLAEAEIIKETTGHFPVLLLDDVFSELDKNRQHYLLEKIGPKQVLLTCTGLEDIVNKLENINIMKMHEGVIHESRILSR